jgi:hypothetical protein
MTCVRSMKRVLFALPVVGAILFGTSQVFAAPAPPKQEASCPEELCTRTCAGPWWCDGLNCVCF